MHVSNEETSCFVDEPLISIIIPSFNRRELLRRAIESVLAQSYPHWELLVVDDCSTDGSDVMVRNLDDHRVRYLRQDQHMGGGFARWLGADQSGGRYIAYLDSDDYWRESKLELQLAEIESAADPDMTIVVNPPIVQRFEKRFETRQSPLATGDDVADYVYGARGGTLQTSSFLLGGELGRRLRFDFRLRVNQDTDYLLRLQAAGAEIRYLDEHLHVHDVTPERSRITLNRDLRQDSLIWYARVSGYWSAAAKRGYFRQDMAVRCAQHGRLGLAFWYLLRGLDLRVPPGRQFRLLAKVLGGGQAPRWIHVPWQWLKRVVSNSHSAAQ